MTVEPRGKERLAKPRSTPINLNWGRCYEVYGWDSPSSTLSVLKEWLFVLKRGSFVCAWPYFVEQGSEATTEEIGLRINMVKLKKKKQRLTGLFKISIIGKKNMQSDVTA